MISSSPLTHPPLPHLPCLSPTNLPLISRRGIVEQCEAIVGRKKASPEPAAFQFSRDRTTQRTTSNVAPVVSSGRLHEWGGVRAGSLGLPVLHSFRGMGFRSMTEISCRIFEDVPIHPSTAVALAITRQIECYFPCEPPRQSNETHERKRQCEIPRPYLVRAQGWPPS